MTEERPIPDRPVQPQTPEEVRERWDLVEKTTMGRYLAAIEERFIVECLTGFAERPQVVVDAGAGRGRLTALLSEYSDRVIATETDLELVEDLAQVASNVTSVLVQPADTRLPLEDSSADCIIAIQVADLGEAEWFHRECVRVLKPGGVIIVNMQNRRSWKGLQARLRKDRYRAEYGSTYYASSLPEFLRNLAATGLEVERILGYNWLPFTRLSDNSLIGPLASIESLLQLRRIAGVSPWVLVSARRPSRRIL